MYGKIPVFRCKVLPLETKRLSKISTVTNDQVRSFGNSKPSNTTAGLTECQYLKNPMEILRQHNFFATFCVAMLKILNPIVGPDPLNYNHVFYNKISFIVRLIF